MIAPETLATMAEYVLMALLHTLVPALKDSMEATVKQVLFNRFHTITGYDTIEKQDLILLYFSDIDDCTLNSCLNGGVCVDGMNSFSCNCAHGFIGDDCNISKLKNQKLKSCSSELKINDVLIIAF